MVLHPRMLLLATSALMPFGVTATLANPLGSQVVGGTATVSGQGSASVTVTQGSPNAIINWNTFNIGTGETTTFVQPNGSSVMLNRVTGGGGSSQVFGTLTANGRVFLVNPDGVLFGGGAVVNIGGFLATTSNIKNADFMAGRYQFTIPGNLNASIVNLGTITATNSGFAALVAPGVRNAGTITANLGKVAMTSANGFTLDFYGDRLITLQVGDSIAGQVTDVATGQPLKALVSNDGTLKANGGRVELTAVAARQVVDAVISNRGVIEANSVKQQGGTIILEAATGVSKPKGAPTQTVKLSGTISAAGKQPGTKGGTIVVTGENVEVTGAKIDVSGQAGGGKVMLGGDWAGGKPVLGLVNNQSTALESYTIANATTLSVDAATTINASATGNGNGGKVILWSDAQTTFVGTIFARGGEQGGNGGFVETSSHGQLAFNGVVGLAAPAGQHGTLLLDPLDATIAVNPGNQVITVSSIQGALATGDVIVTTGATGSDAGNIIVAAPITWSNASALTLSAFQNIAVNANITNSGGASITLHADNTGTGIGTVNFASPSVKISTAGAVSIFYNPSVNPANDNSVYSVNSTSYVAPVENNSDNMAGGATLTAYMLVNTVNDLQNVKNNLSGAYALGKDINASATKNWNGGTGFTPIGASFNGALNGEMHTISGLNIAATNYVSGGLFSNIGSAGVVRDVGLLNASVAIDRSSIASDIATVNVGLLAGSNSGQVIGVFATGNVSLISTLGIAGGLVGYNNRNAVISDSSADVMVAASFAGYCFCSFAGGLGGYAGGLVGVNNGGTIQNSHTAGLVGSNGQSDGGLVGLNSGLIFQSYTSINVQSNAVASGGLVGINVHASGATGFDFTTGVIEQSYSTGPVTQISNRLDGFGDLGGLVGFNAGVISQSHSLSSVSASIHPTYLGGLVGENSGSITQSYAAGAITAGVSDFVGGIVSSNFGTGTAGNYWDKNSTGINIDGAITSVGKTTTELKAGLPTGFDSSVWGSDPTKNNGYPYLKWQFASGSTANPTVLLPSALIPITVAAFQQTKVYGNVDPNLSYQISSGTIPQNSITGSLSRAPGENVGSYAIGQGTLTLPTNYALTFLASTLIINPAPLTITADNRTKQQGTPNPPFTASYSGFMNGQGPSVVSGLTFSTPSTSMSAAGTYPIIPSSAIAANYMIRFVNGALTVTPVVLPPPASQITIPIDWAIAVSTPKFAVPSKVVDQSVIQAANSMATQLTQKILGDLTNGGLLVELLQNVLSNMLALAIPVGATAATRDAIIRDIEDTFQSALTKQNFLGITGRFARGFIASEAADLVAIFLSDFAYSVVRKQFPNDPTLAQFVQAGTYVGFLDIAAAAQGAKVGGVPGALASVLVTEVFIVANAGISFAIENISSYNNTVAQLQTAIDQTKAAATGTNDPARTKTLASAANNLTIALTNFRSAHPILSVFDQYGQSGLAPLGSIGFGP